MRTILTTVGISLLSPHKHDGETLNYDQLINYLREADPVAASAETHSLSHILKKEDRIIFLHSETKNGELCAKALSWYYKYQKYNATIEKIPNLTYAESSFKVKGLRSFVSTMIELVREHKATSEVLINATGGFKAEMAYANLIGLLFDVPVFYIYEAFQDIIMMPSPPIGWDYSLLANYEEFFEWIDDDYRKTSEVNKWLQNLPEEVRFLLEEEDEFTSLSPTGEVFFEAFRARQASYSSIPIWLSSKAEETYKKSDATTQQLFDRTLRKLRDPQLRNGGSGQVPNCDCLVYPRGNRRERLFWFEGEAENPHVCELASHTDESYENLIDRGVKKSTYNDFQEWKDPLIA